jgi:hypothetical protein
MRNAISELKLRGKIASDSTMESILSLRHIESIDEVKPNSVIYRTLNNRVLQYDEMTALVESNEGISAYLLTGIDFTHFLQAL